jgi:hypothetical protein
MVSARVRHKPINRPTTTIISPEKAIADGYLCDLYHAVPWNASAYEGGPGPRVLPRLLKRESRDRPRAGATGMCSSPFIILASMEC